MRPIILLGVVGAALIGVAQIVSTHIAPAPLTEGSTPSTPRRGEMKTQVFVLFDPKARKVVRKAYSVWDPQPEQNLEFVWQARYPSVDDPELVSGQGELLWRISGTSPFDKSSIVSSFRGELKNGRAEGWGLLRAHDGTRYEGQWRGGLYHGRGQLWIPDGSSYKGEFYEGLFHGEGTLVEADGETYEGAFVRGLKHGKGKTRLASGASYRSTWLLGYEDERSRHVQLAQSATTEPASVQFSEAKLTVGVQVEQRPWGVLNYVSYSEGTRISIVPDDKRIMGAWKGGDYMLGAVELDETDGNTALEFRPVPLRVTVKNTSAEVMKLSSIVFEVAESNADMQPVYFKAYTTMWGAKIDACDDSDFYVTKMPFVNFGWNPGTPVKLEYVLADRPLKSPDDVTGIKSAKRGGVIMPSGRVVVYDIEGDLQSFGVNTAFLRSSVDNKGPGDEEIEYIKDDPDYRKRIEMDGFGCGRLSGAECVRRLERAGILGSLAGILHFGSEGQQFGRFDAKKVLTAWVTGRLSQDWTDYRKVQHVHTSVFRIPLTLGVRRRPCDGMAEEATPPDRDPSAYRSISLRVGQQSYIVNGGVSQVLRAGESTSVTFLLSAQQSASSRFRVSVSAGDGTNYHSRSIELLQLVPSITPHDVSRIWRPK